MRLSWPRRRRIGAGPIGNRNYGCVSGAKPVAGSESRTEIVEVAVLEQRSVHRSGHIFSENHQ